MKIAVELKFAEDHIKVRGDPLFLLCPFSVNEDTNEFHFSFLHCALVSVRVGEYVCGLQFKALFPQSVMHHTNM